MKKELPVSLENLENESTLSLKKEMGLLKKAIAKLK